MFNSYRTVNTLGLSYTNWSLNVLYRNNSCFSEIHTKYINTLCGQKVGFFHIKPGGI